MCGILGLIADGPIDLRALKDLASTMQHRGPDGEGYWQSADGRVALAHRRLAILDLSAEAAQPMCDPSGDLVIAFNGEIYNYIEVRRELQTRGRHFRTTSDTEVLLAAYDEWADGCLDRLNGMFAFAIVDQRRHRLFCARDRYGEKPFLYAHLPNLFAFASEYKALLGLREVPLEVDDDRLAQAAVNASYGLDADTATVFRGVEQLLPGEAMEVDLTSRDKRVWRYWDVPRPGAGSKPSFGEAVERFRDLLRDSVSLRLRSDVTVGSCLSGGLDSSAIVCVVRDLLGPDAEYHVFTGRFPGTSADEGPFADAIIGSARVVAHSTEPTSRGFVEDLPDFLWHNELPVGSSSQYAQWCVFRLAREQGVTVLLDGQGSDELLGGYEQYFASYLRALREAGHHDAHREELARIRARYPGVLTSWPRQLFGRLPASVRRWLARSLGRGSSTSFGLRAPFAERVNRTVWPTRVSGFHALASDLYQDSFGRYLTTLLRYGDRNSMAHSREVRLPFCDHRLPELVFSLPPEYIMGEAQTKRLLREAMRGLMPEPVRTRWRKQGFLPPQGTWFKGPLLELARDVLHDKTFENNPLWEPRWWRRVLERVGNGEPHLAWSLWQPLITELWRRHFVSRLSGRRCVAVLAGNR